jgi:TolB-like protein
VTAVRQAIGDSGKDQRLIRTVVGKGLRFIGDVQEENAPGAVGARPMASPPRTDGVNATMQLQLPAKPSIAVLAFNNLSGDPAQEYFADGVVEDIITALSRLKWLFVIARNSSFTYKSRSVDVRQISRELGVHYVLEGSVRKIDNKVRISAQLIDGVSGIHIWAENFDGVLRDIFELQDRITASVISAIEPTLQLAEIDRSKNKSTDSLDAYDAMLRALQLWHRFTEESFDGALACLKHALAIDPSYAPAMAMSAYCYAHRRQQGWAKDIAGEAEKGLTLAADAVKHGPDDSNVLWMAAAAVWQLGMDRRRSKELVRRSLLLNPNSVWALIINALIDTTSGNSREGLESLRQADRLSPYDPSGWIMAGGMSLAHYLEDELEESIFWSHRAMAQNPGYVVSLRLLAACHARLGQMDEAREMIQRLLKGAPQLTISLLRTRMAFMDAQVFGKLANGLRLAGLPD